MHTRLGINDLASLLAGWEDPDWLTYLAGNFCRNLKANCVVSTPKLSLEKQLFNAGYLAVPLFKWGPCSCNLHYVQVKFHILLLFHASKFLIIKRHTQSWQRQSPRTGVWSQGSNTRKLNALLSLRQEHKCSRWAPGYITLNGDKAPPAARDSSEVAPAYC